jgi:hypothetical protein
MNQISRVDVARVCRPLEVIAAQGCHHFGLFHEHLVGRVGELLPAKGQEHALRHTMDLSGRHDAAMRGSTDKQRFTAGRPSTDHRMMRRIAVRCCDPREARVDEHLKGRLGKLLAT